jgi:hypothetical protein
MKGSHIMKGSYIMKGSHIIKTRLSRPAGCLHGSSSSLLGRQTRQARRELGDAAYDADADCTVAPPAPTRMGRSGQGITTA